MRLLGLPQTIGEAGHKFRHVEFLRWIAEKYNVSLARLWSSVISEHTTSQWLSRQKEIQRKFEELYLQFCDEAGYDKTEVMFDNPPDNTEAINRSNNRQSRRINKTKLRTWNVIEITAGEAETLTKTIPITASTTDTTIVSYEEILRSFGVSEPAAPDSKQVDKL